MVHSYSLWDTDTDLMNAPQVHLLLGIAKHCNLKY